MDGYDEEQVDAHVRAVAECLPFVVELFAEMDGPSTLQIDLGRRGGPDDPPDSASIDPTIEPAVWTIDIEGGCQDIESAFGLHNDPAVVAQWIAEQAFKLGCPVARDES